jgi:hypothetical protein
LRRSYPRQSKGLLQFVIPGTLSDTLLYHSRSLNPLFPEPYQRGGPVDVDASADRYLSALGGQEGKFLIQLWKNCRKPHGVSFCAVEGPLLVNSLK